VQSSTWKKPYKRELLSRKRSMILFLIPYRTLDNKNNGIPKIVLAAIKQARATCYTLFMFYMLFGCFPTS
jgi:hypothetical protein